jgi:hypothetical protein
MVFPVGFRSITPSILGIYLDLLLALEVPIKRHCIRIRILRVATDKDTLGNTYNISGINRDRFSNKFSIIRSVSSHSSPIPPTPLKDIKHGPCCLVD